MPNFSVTFCTHFCNLEDSVIGVGRLTSFGATQQKATKRRKFWTSRRPLFGPSAVTSQSRAVCNFVVGSRIRHQNISTAPFSASNLPSQAPWRVFVWRAYTDTDAIQVESTAAAAWLPCKIKLFVAHCSARQRLDVSSGFLCRISYVHSDTGSLLFLTTVSCHLVLAVLSYQRSPLNRLPAPRGGVAVGSDKWYLSHKVKTLYH